MNQFFLTAYTSISPSLSCREGKLNKLSFERELLANRRGIIRQLSIEKQG